MRLWFSKAVAIFSLFGSLILAGCGGERQQSTVAPSVKLMMWGLPDELETVKSYLAKFNTLHPEIRVEIIHQPQRYDEKLDTMFAGGTPPDVMYISAERMPRYALRGVLEDLRPYVQRSPDFKLEDFYPSLVQAFEYDGKLLGIPKDFTTLVLYYNKTMFDKAGLQYPNENWTWEDFVRAAKALTQDVNGDGRIDQYGFVLETWTAEWLPWIWQNGGEMMDATRSRWLLGDRTHLDANAEALQFLVDLVVKEKVAPSAEVTNDLGTFDLFQTGKAGMCTYGRWKCMDFKHIKDFEWDVAAIPSGKQKAGVLFVVSYAIAQRSKQKETAWELVKFLTGPDGQIATAESGHAIPSMTSVAASKHFLEAPAVPQPIHAQVFLDAIPYSRTPPTRPNWPEIGDILGREMDLMWRGQRPIKETLLKMQPQIEKLLPVATTGS